MFNSVLAKDASADGPQPAEAMDWRYFAKSLHWKIFQENIQDHITINYQIIPADLFYILWKYQKIRDFLMFSRGLE